MLRWPGRTPAGLKNTATVFAAADAANPPLLEPDADDNLNLVRLDFVDGHAYLYRFLARESCD